MKTKAAIYIRVSTMNQVDKSSLKTQEERLIAYCTANEMTAYKVYRDAGLSAKDTKRPSLTELMRDCRSGLIDTVVVTKLDRITRSLSDLLKLVQFFNKREIRFISISENIDSSTAMGRFMRDLLGLIAQLERQVTGERVATDLKHRATKGKWNGGPVPFGYATQKSITTRHIKDGISKGEAFSKATIICPEPGKLYIQDNEAEIIKIIFMRFIEYRSIRKVTHEINRLGYRTRRGAMWATSTIHRILTNQTYNGMTFYGKRKTDPETGEVSPRPKEQWTIVEGEHDAIIDAEMFNAVQHVLGATKVKPTKKGRAYLLSGLLKCGYCGHAMVGNSFTKPSGKRYAYYKCSARLQKGTAACQGQSARANELEEQIVHYISSLAKNTDFLSSKEKMINQLEKDNGESSVAKVDKIAEQEKLIKRKLNVLLAKLENEVIDDDDFGERYRKLKDELTGLEERRLNYSNHMSAKDAAVQNLRASFEEITKFNHNWEFLDDTGKQLRLGSIVREIRVTDDDLEIDIYLDVGNMSNTVRGSSPRSGSAGPGRSGSSPLGRWSLGRLPGVGATTPEPICRTRAVRPETTPRCGPG